MAETDIQQWIEERREILSRAELSRVNYTVASMIALAGLPRALDAIEAINAQIDRMEADANIYGDGGHDLACDALFTYVGTLREAIEGAINE